MSSFTSSSSPEYGHPAGPWARVWVAAAVLAVALVAALEVGLRRAGHETSLADDMDLWCVQRDAAARGDLPRVALVGSSRMLIGVDTALLRREFPGAVVVELAILAKDGLATLEDLADDPRFTGTVLFDFQPHALLPSAWDDQGDHSTYYHAQWNAYRRLERSLQTRVQRHLVCVSPNLNPHLFTWALRHRTWPARSCHRVLEDRSMRVDFEKPGVTEQERRRVSAPEGQTPRGHPSDASGWFNGLSRLNHMADRIEARGGRVVLVGFPLGAEARATLNRYFPSGVGWDDLPGRTRAAVVRAEDLPGAGLVTCYDGAHMDVRNSALFTKALADELRRRGLVSGLPRDAE